MICGLCPAPEDCAKFLMNEFFDIVGHEEKKRQNKNGCLMSNGPCRRKKTSTVNIFSVIVTACG
jgi:hypothetical protein